MAKITTLSRADRACFMCTLSECVSGARKNVLDQVCVRQRLINADPCLGISPLINTSGEYDHGIDRRNLPDDSETRYILHVDVL